MYSAEAALDLANELVVFLRRKFRDTHRQREWTQRNIRFLRQFARKKKVQSFPSAEGKTGKRRAKQFVGLHRPSIRKRDCDSRRIRA